MLKVLYAGSPQAAATTLEILLKNAAQNNFSVVGVLTNPPKMQGRHSTLVPTPVQTVAEQNCVPVFTPEHLDSTAREEIAKCGADILVCFAFGKIFGPKFMSLFKFGGINLHPSALPKYRGCTPVNASILNMDKETAFSVQTLSQRMDEGDILAQKIVPLTGKETAVSLLNQAAIDGAELILSVLKKCAENNSLPQGKKQEGEPSYTSFIQREDARIDWTKSAEQIDALVRAYYPEPAGWTQAKDFSIKLLEGFAISDEEGKTLGADLSLTPGTVALFCKPKGILIKCGTGFYVVKQIHQQYKKPMDYKSYINGARDFVGTRLE